MPKNIKKNTILILEDEIPLQQAIQKKIEKEGFSSVTARSVKQAIDYLEEVKGIGLIWVDHYLLGKETGLDFVALVKRTPRWKNIPIMIVSNTASPNKVKNYLSLGVDKYYIKSNFRIDQLIAEIRKILK